MRNASLIPLLLLILAPPLRADRITLNDQTRLEGRILREDDTTLVIETYKEGPVTVRKDQIKRRKDEPSKLDAYDRKKAAAEDTADGHFKLGQWCRKSGLDYRADLEWRRAVELDPGHEKSRKALGHVQVEGKWLTEEEYKKSQGLVKYEGKWIKKAQYDKLRLKGAVEIKIKVAVKPDADAAWLEKLKGKLEQAAEGWWKCTEGQMYISEAEVSDRSSGGDVVINNLNSATCDGTAYGRCINGTVYLGGRFPIVTFCHEMGHRWCQLPDEYQKPKCARCVMEPWSGIFEFCDKNTHTAKGADCWTRIKKIYPKWKHPRKDFGEAPPIKVKIKNN
ncbi:MAG: hypothetical protein ACYTAF_17100 [Planctomycetota bacterium]